jgi:hypothetical protein
LFYRLVAGWGAGVDDCPKGGVALTKSDTAPAAGLEHGHAHLLRGGFGTGAVPTPSVAIRLQADCLLRLPEVPVTGNPFFGVSKNTIPGIWARDSRLGNSKGHADKRADKPKFLTVDGKRSNLPPLLRRVLQGGAQESREVLAKRARV